MTTSSRFIGCPEASQQSTTHQLSDISGLTFTPGKMVEYDCNQTVSFTLNTNYYTEHEYNFNFTDAALDGTAYCFRVVNSDATTLSTYSVYPKITTSGAAAPSLGQVIIISKADDRDYKGKGGDVP